MTLLSVLSVDLKPDRIQDHQTAVAELAEKARATNDEFRWTAHEAAYGEVGRIYFAAGFENFDGLGQRGLTPAMVMRVMGEARGQELLRTLGECSVSMESGISTDRPDLSYPQDDDQRISPATVVTRIVARPGHQEACEELIRKVAEAIPKVGDPARMSAFQSVMGNLSLYFTIRPIENLSELDHHTPPNQLLLQAFGNSEGGLIYRAGLDAIESATRSVLIYREDLSNPE